MILFILFLISRRFVKLIHLSDETEEREIVLYEPLFFKILWG